MLFLRNIIIILLVLISSVSKGQYEELKNSLQGKEKFSEASIVIQKYINDLPDGRKKDKLNKQFARWAYYQSFHLDSNGEMVNISERTYRAVENKIEDPSRSANGDWTFIGPSSSENDNTNARYNGVGRVDRIAFHPTNSNVIYIGTPAGGLWRTSDGGATWTPLSSYIPSLGISGIVIDHSNTNRIYVLTGSGDAGGLVTGAGYLQYSIGVLVSNDAGSTWEQTSTLSANNNFNGFRLAQSPQDSQILFAATNDGIYKTKNGGDSWIQVKAGKFYDIEFKPGNPTTVYASGISSFYYSVDTGNFWTQATYDIAMCGGRTEIAVSNASPNTVYMIAGGGVDEEENTFCGFYKSIDSGQSFDRQTNSPNLHGKANGTGDQSGYDLAIAVSPTNSQRVFTAGLIVWRTIDGGLNFEDVTAYNETGAEFYIHPDVHDLAINPLNGTLYAATDGGMYSSTDNGDTWNDLKDGISTTQIFHMDDYNSDNNYILFGSQDNGIKYRNTNTEYFSNVGSGDGFDVVIDYSDNTKGWAVMNESVNRYTHFLNNSWSNIHYLRSFFPQVEINTADPDRVYYSYDSIFTILNNTKTLIGNGEVNGFNVLRTCSSNSNRIYAAGGYNCFSSNGKMYETSDGGSTWDTVSNSPGFPALNQRITDIAVNPNNSAKVFFTCGGYEADQKVFYSSNAGDTWFDYTFDLPNVPIWSIEVDASNSLYVGTDIGVFYKSVSSNNWEPYYNNLPNVPISDLAINESENQILASTFGRGIWKSELQSDCPEYLAETGNIEGNYFKSASIDISTNSNIVGGEGTEVIFRAGEGVYLYPGFRANGNDGNKFMAYNGDCNDGIPPEFQTGILSYHPNSLSNYSMKRSGSKGTIEIISRDKIKIRKFTNGNTVVAILDEKGAIVSENDYKLSKKGEYDVTINTSGIDANICFLYLIIDDEITHMQELVFREGDMAEAEKLE